MITGIVYHSSYKTVDFLHLRHGVDQQNEKPSPSSAFHTIGKTV